MSEHTQEILELAPTYALGALVGDDLERFEAHLASGCEVCAEELRLCLMTADELIGGIAPVAPSSDGLDRLMARVDDERGATRGMRDDEAIADAVGGFRGNVPGVSNRGVPRSSPIGQSTPVGLARTRGSRRWSPFQIAASIAALGAIVGLSGQLRSVYGDLAVERSERRAAENLAERAMSRQEELAQRLDVLRIEKQESAMRLAHLDAMIGTATSATRREVRLAATGEAPGAQARAIVDPRAGGLVLVVDSLPPLRADQTYQLWVIVDGAPISVGIFDLKADGTTRFGERFSEDLSPGVTIAISIEPGGGVPQPTGPIVLAGT